MRKLICLLLLSGPLVLHAQSATPAQDSAAQEQEPAWMVKLDQRQQQLASQNGPGTDAALRDQLVRMRAEDQDARGFANGQPKDKDHAQFAPNLAEIDRKLTDELKAIVTAHGWPTIHLVGMEASTGAMLILTHSADHVWQRSLLPSLEKLAREGKIDGSQLALVVDKQLVAAGKLQRYGSQFKFQDGEMMMFAVEDPATLDQRREAVLLPPLAEYKKMLAEMYHLKASDMIVRATPPASEGAAPAKKR